MNGQPVDTGVLPDAGPSSGTACPAAAPAVPSSSAGDIVPAFRSSRLLDPRARLPLLHHQRKLASLDCASVEFVLRTPVPCDFIEVQGAITRRTADGLRDFVLASSLPDQNLRLDLTGVDGIDMAGITVLSRLRRRQVSAGGSMKIRGNHEHLVRVLYTDGRLGEATTAPARLDALMASSAPVERTEVLSRLEREVLVARAKGLTVTEVGRALFVSASAVEAHIKNILDKLGAHDHTHAMTLMVARDPAFMDDLIRNEPGWDRRSQRSA